MEEGSWNALRKRKVFSFFLKVVVLLVEWMWTGRLFHAREADTLAHRTSVSCVGWPVVYCWRELSPETSCNNFDSTNHILCRMTDSGWYTFPTPGTSTPLIGRGISTLRTVPYLPHSSFTSSTMSVTIQQHITTLHLSRVIATTHTTAYITSTAADTSSLCRFLQKKILFYHLITLHTAMFWYISGINILRKSGFICRNVSNLSFKLFLNFEYK